MLRGCLLSCGSMLASLMGLRLTIKYGRKNAELLPSFPSVTVACSSVYASIFKISPHNHRLQEAEDNIPESSE